MSLTYHLEGFPLHQPDQGYLLMEGTQFAPEIAPRRVNIVLPNAHGEVPAWNDPLDTTELALRVRIRGDSPDELRERWEVLRALTGTGGNRPLTLTRVHGSQELEASVQLLTMDVPDFWCAAGMVQTTMVLHNPSGRWQEPEAVEQMLATDGQPQQVDFAAESTAPVTNALVRVQGPISFITVTDATNNTGFQWTSPDTPLDETEYLLVDCASYTAWRNDDAEWDSRDRNVTHGLVTTGSGMLSLVRAYDSATGQFTNTVATELFGDGAATELYIRGKRTYI